MVDETAIAVGIDASMIARSVHTEREPSILDTIHKVKIYNPNWFNNEVMDADKKGKLILTEANTWEEKIIEPFKFWLISNYKVISWSIPMLDELWDTIVDSKWKPVKKYFYTNQFYKFTKNTDTIWFRSSDKNSEPLWFIKQDLLTMIKTPNLNGKPNPFYKQGIKSDGSKYKTTLLNTQDVIYWVILDWDYKWEYFQFYVKPSAMWSNYDFETKSRVSADEWSLTRVIDDALIPWNKILKDNWAKEINYMPIDQLDIKLNIKSIEVSWKEFNVAEFEFAWFSWTRWNNIDDVSYIHQFNKDFYFERFPTVTDIRTVKVEWINCIVSIDFNTKEWLTHDDVEDVFPDAVSIWWAAF